MTSHPHAAALIGATAILAATAGAAGAQKEEPKPPTKAEAEAAKPKDCAEGYHMVGGRCLRDPAAKQAPGSAKPEAK